MKYNNTISFKPRPLVVAICGKSASGKDTLARWLESTLKLQEIPVNSIISDTTRPPRSGEIDGINYNFLTEAAFHEKINSEQYLEYTNFNGWFYGTDKDALEPFSTNIGIFNPDGLIDLIMRPNDCDLVIIYLKCNIIERLSRSYRREGKFRLEHFRRAIADWHGFRGIDTILKNARCSYVVATDRKGIRRTLDEVLLFLKDR